MVAHIEELEELHSVAPAHVPNRRVSLEHLAKVEAVTFHGSPLGFQELAHLETITGIPHDLQWFHRIDTDSPIVKVDTKYFHRLRRAAYHNSINQAAFGHHAGRTKLHHGLRND